MRATCILHVYATSSSPSAMYIDQFGVLSSSRIDAKGPFLRHFCARYNMSLFDPPIFYIFSQYSSLHDVCFTGPLPATTRVGSLDVKTTLDLQFLPMRFLDQFALDLRSQKANQPPGGPVPCTTADVRVTELDERVTLLTAIRF